MRGAGGPRDGGGGGGGGGWPDVCTHTSKAHLFGLVDDVAGPDPVAL